MNDSGAHFLGEGVFARNYYIVFATIPDFPVAKEPSVLAFNIADAKTLSHIPEADVIIKLNQGEKVISTLEEKYIGYDAFVGYTFQHEGQHKVIFEISVANDPELITAEFDVQVQQKENLVFKTIEAPISGEPSGNVVIRPDKFFEVGVIMNAGETIQYSYSADATVFFNLHSHDKRSTTNHVVSEGRERIDSFMAPTTGNYYFLWENLGSSEVRINYDILFPRMTQTINYENELHEITFVSNSKIESITFDQPKKQILMNVKTPFLTPGFINMTIPKVLLDGSFNVKGGSAQFILIEGDSESVLLINTDDGTHDVAIVGTTAILEIPFPLIIFLLSMLIIVTLAKIKIDKKMF
ncbi:MAG: hypothetical protein ACE5J2_00425 [Nitrososphaerales archaeon]